MTEIRILPDAPSLAQNAARQFSALAAAAIQARGYFSVALAGGSTPQALYRLLAGPPFAGEVDWRRVHVFWGDERCVPPDHPDSNYGMARLALLDHVPLLPENIHRMAGEKEPQQAAAGYEEELRAFFEARRLSSPCFDLVLLGMGEDGHTASLFPGTAAVREQERWVVAHLVAALKARRITLTPVILNQAAQTTFLVSGAGKAERLRQVLEGPAQPEQLPAQAIHPQNGRLTWLVDEAAVSGLSR